MLSPNCKTFADVLDLWLEGQQLKVKKATYSTYLRAAAKHILPSIGACPIDCLTAKELSKFLRELEKDLSPSSQRLVCVILRSTLRFAKERGFTELEHSFHAPRGAGREMRALTVEEQRQLELVLLQLAREDLRVLGLLLCLYTGLRLGEICAMNWDCFTSDCGAFYVRQTIQRIARSDGPGTELIFSAPKSENSYRCIPVPAGLQPVLRSARADGAAYLLTGTQKPMEPRSLQRRFKRILVEAGVADINFHALRHTFATNCVAAGCDVCALSKILGHSDVSVTLNTYVHPSFDAMKAVMDKLAPVV